MMNKKRLFQAVIASLALQGAALDADQHYPDNMIFLGDSISDVGNAQPSAQVPVAPYPQVISATPITNGLTFAGLLGTLLEIDPVTPSTIGGLDFAYAGALTIQDVQSLNNPGLPLISLYNQIDLIPKKVSRKTPVFSLGGANDFLRPILDGSFNFPSGTEVATNMVEVVKKVKRKGFKTQIISNLPNLGAIPFITTIGLEAPLTLLTAQFNLELRNQLRDQDIKIIQIDAANLFSLISADPAKYGFPHGTELPVPNANLAGYMFYYDGVHPSEALDRIFADYVFAQFEAANGYGALADLPLAVLRQQNNSLLQQLYPLVPCRECGTIYPFISGNVAPLLTEDQYAFSKRDGYGGNVTGGITQRLFDCLTWGAGVSYARTHDKGCHNYKTNLSTVSGSLFGSYVQGNAYTNLLATGSWLDFSNIDRTYRIGPVTEKIKGDTEGAAFYGLLNGGYNIYSTSCISTGPIASIEYGVARVDGYREHGGDAGNLQYRKQTGQNLITGLGWQANFDYIPQNFFNNLGLNLSLSVNRQWLENRRSIYFREISLDGSYGALPYKNTRSTYFSGVANFYTELCNNILFSAGYFFNVGSYSLSEHGITFGLSMPFGGL